MPDIAALLTGILSEDEVKYNEPMSRHTTFKIGGPADVYAEPRGEDALAAAVSALKDAGAPFAVVGCGSNLLVRDAGFRGAVLSTHAISGVTRVGDCLRVGAGATLAKTAAEALRHSLAGLEFASGIPGSFGGAVFMNAGAYGGEMADVLVSARVLTEGAAKDIPAGRLGFSYRKSALAETGGVILSGTVRLSPGDAGAIRARTLELNASRAAKQPLDLPSAGSAFKRPPGSYASKLIDECGLRGYTVGGASVSGKHCGFIVNNGRAAAADVERLMADVIRVVAERTGYILEPEVRILG
ncbi:MAG: UDP-N-acetylmuramate dehydrogenase [Clostridiales bacterium]|jgi:UDP-N-acetylmuramate dehydrogenase|nr:UDP-N-acetylmuramate dehydrogenase [Clostridiales bacterium]